jgi:hypothetical protein
MENTNLHLSHHKQDHQNLHDTHPNQIKELHPLLMLLKGILKTSHGSMITLSHDPPIFSSSSPPIDGIIFQRASACLLSLINELIL